MGIDPVSIGIQLALVAAQMGLAAMRKIEGPRLDSTKLNSGDYGATITRGWGDYWVTPPLFWGEDLKHVEEENKTKGGKSNQHKYFGTAAWLLAPHPTDALLRIKLDGHLVYDMTGAGPVTPFDFGSESGGGGKGGGSAAYGGFSMNEHMAFYPGTADQEPDERMLAWVESRFGVGSCPAYRGKSYLVLKDLPLEKFGNRIPQLTAEIVSAGSANYPWETFDTATTQPHRLWGATFSTDGARFMWGSGGDYEIWDVAARARMLSGNVGVNLDPQHTFGMYANGDFLAVDSTNQVVYQFAGDGTNPTVLYVFDDILMASATRVVMDGGGTEHWFTIPYLGRDEFVVDGTEWDMNLVVGANWAPVAFFADLAGNIWAVGTSHVSGTTTAYFYRVITVEASGPAYHAVSSLAANTSGLAGCSACVAPNGTFVLLWGTGAGGMLYAVDPATGAVTDSLAISLDVYNTAKQVANFRAGAATIWLGVSEVDLDTLTALRTVDLTDWKAEDADGIIYDPINHALICAPQFDQVLTWRYLDRAGSSGVTWGTVVADTCALAGCDPDGIITAALTMPINGYTVGGGSGKDWIEPGNDLFDIDPRPHGFALEFLPRGGAAGATLSSEDFAGADDGAALYQWIGRQGGTDVPAEVSVRFADTAIDHKPNATQSGPFQISDGAGKRLLDMSTLASDAATMQQLTVRYHRRLAFDSGGLSLAVPSKQIALEPGDVLPLDLRGDGVTARLVSIEMQADRRFALEFKRDDPSVAELNAAVGAPADGQDASAIVVPGLAKGFVLDMPLLSDLDEAANPPAYVAASTWAADIGFAGAAIYQAVPDGLGGSEYTDSFASVTSANRATWGYTTDVLGDVSAPWVWDRGSSVNVLLQVGSLAGTTEAAIDANPAANLVLIGSELLNFATATLEGDGSYTLSGLKRARKGTEWATGTHAVGEAVLLLTTAAAVQVPLSDVGTDLSFKAVANGRTLSGAFPIDIAPFTGASLKPYAPAQLRGLRNFGSNDWALTWVRRSRIGGAWTSGMAVPLGEAAEEYEVEIMNGGSVVRTVTGLTSPTTTYSSAQQVTDFGSNQSAVTFRVYQISDAVGRGFVAQATV